MKIAIIGCGEIAGLHIKALNSSRLHPIICIDKDLDNARKFAQKHEIKHYSDSISDIKEFGITHAHVCTPPNFHFEQISYLLNNNVNVFSEKPLALDEDEAKKLLELAKKKHRRVAVNFNNRAYPTVENLKNMITDGKLGKINMVRTTYLQEYHMLPTPISWRYFGTMRALSEIGTHAVDLATFITGSKLTLSTSKLGRFNKDRHLKNGIMYPISEGEANLQIETEDAAVITAIGENSELFVFTLSETTAARKNYLQIEIDGELASASWNSEDPSRLIIRTMKDGQIETYNPFNSGFDGSFERLIKLYYMEQTHPTEFFEAAYRGIALLKEAALQDSMPIQIAEKLGLSILPVEGTYYKNTYVRLDENGSAQATAMIGMFSRKPHSHSNFHVLEYDEIWHHYGGETIEIILLYPDGKGEKRILGAYPNEFQILVPAGVYQAARIHGNGDYALFGCTMSPGFSASCFSAPSREELLEKYPDFKEEILQLTNFKEINLPEGFER